MPVFRVLLCFGRNGSICAKIAVAGSGVNVIISAMVSGSEITIAIIIFAMVGGPGSAVVWSDY